MLVPGESHTDDVQEKGQGERRRRGQDGRSRSHNCPRRAAQSAQCRRRSRCCCLYRRRRRRYQVLHAHRCEEAPVGPSLPRQPPVRALAVNELNEQRSSDAASLYNSTCRRGVRAVMPLAIRRVKSEDFTGRAYGTRDLTRSRVSSARRRSRRSRGDFNARLSTPSIGKTVRERARRRAKKG